MPLRNKHIFTTLCILFLVYSISIYLQPVVSKKSSSAGSPHVAGQLVWQKYNCQACHQLYGLGGYLGPDLTNVYSAGGKGETFIKAMVRSGTTQMPSFQLSDEEESDLVSYLKCVDASGIADPRNFNSSVNGMIKAK